MQKPIPAAARPSDRVAKSTAENVGAKSKAPYENANQTMMIAALRSRRGSPVLGRPIIASAARCASAAALNSRQKSDLGAKAGISRVGPNAMHYASKIGPSALLTEPARC